ncbi:MAG: hypothetical protein PVF65_08390 [Sphingomonadales bacterium]|jgi:hypothetical protein
MAKTVFKPGFCALMASAAVVILASIADAATLQGVRTGRHEGYLRLVLDLDEDIPVRFGVANNKLLIILPDNTQAPSNLNFIQDQVAGRFVPARGDNPPYIEVEAEERMALRRRFTLPARLGTGTRLVMDFSPAPKVEAPAPTPATPEPTVVAPTTPAETAPTETTEPADDYVIPDFPDLETFGGTAEPSTEISGFVEAELRSFPQNSDDGVSSHFTGSFALAPKVTFNWDGGDQQIVIAPFGRVDVQDDGRTHADIREAKYVGAFGPLELRLGFDTVFWGVTESVHLVDIINQDDALEDIDQEDKLGQLMANVRYVSDIGTFSFYALPWSRERDFAGRKGRPNTPLPIDRSQTQWQSDDEDWRFTWAARWSKAAGPFDIGLSYFSGNARDPRLLLGQDALGAPVLIPRYDVIKQAGVDVQATFGPLLLKTEAIHQWNDFDDFAAFAAGFEYSFFNVGDGAGNLGVLAEYLYDERDDNLLAPFEDDLFFGLRWSSNDVAGTQILAGAVVDLDGDGNAINVEMSRRLGSKWSISVDARLFTGVDSGDPLQFLADDDFIQLRIARHF